MILFCVVSVFLGDLFFCLVFGGMFKNIYLIGVSVALFLKSNETIKENELQMVTSESQIRFDAVSAELLDWILKSKAAIQATEIKEYKKMQETSEMKKKLKVKHKSVQVNKIFHRDRFAGAMKM